MNMLNIFVCLLLSMSAYANLSVTPVTDACSPEMQTALTGNGIQVISCTSNCHSLSSGTFTVDDGLFGTDFTSGIILTNGLAASAQGPNGFFKINNLIGTGGDPDLQSLSSQNLYDACSITLQVRFSGSAITWKYVFGSDEYEEFVGSPFADIFGFFIQGPNHDPKENVALVPGTSTTITINTVNQFVNTQYYVSNMPSGSNAYPEIAYDGFTTGLFVNIDNLVPGADYTLKLAIADGSDASVDSGVLVSSLSIAVSLVVNGYTQITIECGEALPEVPTTTASQFCSEPAVVFSESTVDGDCTDSIKHITTRTWTATDTCGNSATATQTITVKDTTAPVISSVSDETVECNSVPDISEVTATDACGNTPTEVLTTEERTDGSCPNSYTLTRTYSTSDSCGNTASASQTITVQDTHPPILNGVPADITVQCASDVPSPPHVTATDCGTATIAVSMTETSTPGTCSNRKTIQRTWTATDSCGNTATQSQTITVNDNTPPTVTKLHDICIFPPMPKNYYCESPSTIWSVSDNCQGAVSSNFNCTACTQPTHGDADDANKIKDQCKIIDGKICFNAKKDNCYTATETYTDQCGNSVDASISVSVKNNHNGNTCVTTNYSPDGRGDSHDKRR